MGQNAVGNLSIVIGANADPFDAVTDRVVRDTNALPGRVKKSSLDGLIQFTGSARDKSPGEELEKVRKKAEGGLGVSGVMKFAVGLGAAATAGGLVEKALETIEDKARLGAAGRALGLTAQQFTGIAAVAKSVGEDSREFIESLVTMGKVGADAVGGNGLVAPQFFKALNLDAKEFVGLRTDQQFFRIFEALEKVQDPLTRTRALMVAFGEDGGKFLLPLLSKSSAEIRRMAGGLAITDKAMAEFERTQGAVVKANGAIGKAWDQSVVAAAPLIAQLASRIPSLIDALVPKFEAVGTAGEKGFGKVEAAAQKATLGSVGLQGLSYVGEYSGAGFKSLGAELKDPIGALLGAFIPGRWGAEETAAASKGLGIYDVNAGGLSPAHLELGGDIVRQRGLSLRGGTIPIPPATPETAKTPAELAFEQKQKQQEDARQDAAATMKVAEDAAKQRSAAFADGLRGTITRGDPARKLADETLKLNDALARTDITMGMFREGARLAWREYAADAPKALAGPLEQLRETQRVMAIGVRHGAFRPDEATAHVRGAFDNYARDQRDQFERNGGGQVARFRLEAGLLNQQASPGLGLISRQQADAGIGRLAEDLAKVFDRAEAQLPAAMLAGSQEAESVITKAMTAGQGGGKDPTARIVDAINKLGMKELTEEKVKRAMGQAIQQHLKVTAGGV